MLYEPTEPVEAVRNNSEIGDAISNCLATVSADSQYMGAVNSVSVVENGHIAIVFSGCTTEDEVYARLDAQPVQIAYKLASPIEIQLTPHIITAADPEQVNTLYGDGRIDAEYVKPLHVSIEERVAAAMQDK